MYYSRSSPLLSRFWHLLAWNKVLIYLGFTCFLVSTNKFRLLLILAGVYVSDGNWLRASIKLIFGPFRPSLKAACLQFFVSNLSLTINNSLFFFLNYSWWNKFDHKKVAQTIEMCIAMERWWWVELKYSQTYKKNKWTGVGGNKVELKWVNIKWDMSCLISPRITNHILHRV